MKRKITYVIILSLIFFPLTVLCGGCGGVAQQENGGEPVIEALPERDSREEKDFIALQKELRPAVLQILCGDYRGSGVVWEITDEEVTVVSSAHLLKNGDACEVLCHAGVYYEAKVDRILEDCDVGFAVFPADALREDGVELMAVIPSERTAAELVQGEELVVYGSMNAVAADFVKGYLIDGESEIQINGYSNAQPLLLGGIVREALRGDAGEIEADSADADTAKDSGKEGNAVNAESGSRDKGAVDAGMSGCGVFDRSGKLLGILAGGDGESGFAAVPVWRILKREQG